MSKPQGSPLPNLIGLDGLSAAQLRRLLTEHLTKRKLGLYWENSTIDRDAALTANIVLPRMVDDYSHGLQGLAAQGTPNLIIEGDNYDSLRLLMCTAWPRWTQPMNSMNRKCCLQKR